MAPLGLAARGVPGVAEDWVAMRRLDGAVVLITGATDGLGRAVADELADAGARVLVHGRDPQRVARTVHAISRTAEREPAGYVADFAHLDDVRRLARQVRNEEERLDVLVNNAGIGAGASESARELSADGHELRFQVNYLAAFMLSRLLLPLLRASAPARIVNVASGLQQSIDFDDVMLERDYDGWRAYAQSKLAMVADVVLLARHLDAGEVTANALHPGSLMDTKMVRESVGAPQRPLDEGVEAVARLVADSDLDGLTGGYFDGQRPAQAHELAHDSNARAALAHLSAELTGVSAYPEDSPSPGGPGRVLGGPG